MKKIDLGQTITILANLGVIAGIVFLAIELRQNNELMEADSRAARNVRVQNLAEQIYIVPGLAEIFVKTSNGEPLSESEEMKVFGFNLRRIRGFEAAYQDYLEGSGNSFDLDTWRNAFEGAPYNIPMHDAWERSKSILGSDEFIQFMEENVVNR